MSQPPSKGLAFGSCCKALKEAMEIPQQKFLWTSDDGIFYLTIGAVRTEQGTGWMDQAVLFCPFCGVQIQTMDEIRAKTGSRLP